MRVLRRRKADRQHRIHALWLNPLLEDGTFSTYRMFLTALFLMTMMIGSVLSVETVQAGPFSLPAGAFVFPLCFCVLTVFQEVYGIPQSLRLAIIGILMFGLAILLVEGVNLFPPAHDSVTATGEFRDLYGVPPRVLASSVLGFSFAVTTGLAVLYVSARHTGTERRLMWLRLVGAPLLMQVITAYIAITLNSIGGGSDFGTLADFLLQRTLYAVVFANLAAPFIWYAVLHIRHRELPRPMPHPRYPDVFREETQAEEEA